MPEARLARTRPSLPSGYQFGDARSENAPPEMRGNSLSPVPKWLVDELQRVFKRNQATYVLFGTGLGWNDLTRGEH